MRNQIIIAVAATVAVVALFGPAVAPAAAQVETTGSVQGRVLDPSGNPLPGVTVIATGSSLIGEQITYTGPNGGYRVPLLPAGTYRLIFELPGFDRVERAGTVVGVRRVTSIDMTLTLSGLEEAVTVTGYAPLIDVKSTKRSSEISDSLINMLPEARGVGNDLMSLSPDASIPSGGNFSGTPSFFGAPPNAVAYEVDGVNVSDPEYGSQFPFYSPDWFEVVEITPTGGGAEIGKAMGAVFNVVTKSGSNDFHGEANFYFQNDAFLGDNTANITSEVEDFTSPELNYRYDFSLNVGGPLVSQRAWFFAGYQGYYDEEKSPRAELPVVVDADRFFGKITWQASNDHRLVGSVMADTYTLDVLSSPWIDPEAGYHMPSFNFTPNITWNWIAGDNTFVEIKYSGFYGYYDFDPFVDASPWIEVSTFTLYNAFIGHYTFDRSRSNAQGSVSHFAEDFAGQHSLRLGAEWERLRSYDTRQFGPNPQGEQILYYAYYGEPYLAYQYSPNVDVSNSFTYVTTVYAQDDWTVANRLTLNLGLRFDRWDIGFVDAQRSDEPVFNDLAPRLGINFDLFGDGRAALYGSWGRYFEEAHGTIFDEFTPQRAGWIGSYWDGAEWVEFFRFDPLTERAIDPDLRNVHSDQVSVGLDVQILDNLSLGGRFIHKRDERIIGAQDIQTAYVPIEVVNADGNVMTIFAAEPYYDPFFLLTNNPSSHYAHVGELYREYDGLQVTFNRRLADDWALIGSWIYQKATGNAQNNSSGNNGGGRFFNIYDTPNDFITTPGELINSRRHVVKLQGTWLMPDPLRLLVGAQFDAASGRPSSIEERFDYQLTGRLPASDRTVSIRPIGSERLDPLVNLNLRVEKRFALPGAWGDIGVVFDVFNVFNADTVRNVWSRVPLYGEPTAIVAPRTFRLGTRWLF